MSLSLVHHSCYTVPFPPRHRFPIGKFAALKAHLDRGPFADRFRHVVPEPADAALLERAHTTGYVADVLACRLDPTAIRRIGVPVTPPVVMRATASVGGTVAAVEAALDRGIASNTAGGSHHAHAGFGAGFCVFNDVAVAACHAHATGRAGRVVIIDLDVHQGDGTARILEDQPWAVTFSMHGARNFPVRKARSTIDIELPDGTGDAAYLDQLEDALPGLLDAPRPDLVIYLAGVDPHRDNRLGRLALTDRGLAAREHLVLDRCLARGIPVATVLGGGYDEDVEALARRHALAIETAVRLAEAYRL